MLLPPMAMSPPSGAMESRDHAQERRLAAADGPRIEKKLPRSTRMTGNPRQVIRETLDDGVRYQIRRAQLAAFTRSSTRPSILEAGRYGGVPVDALEIVVGNAARTAP